MTRSGPEQTYKGNSCRQRNPAFSFLFDFGRTAGCAILMMFSGLGIAMMQVALTDR